MTGRKNHKPPAIASWLLKQLFPDRGHYTSLGDFEEEYNALISVHGSFRARMWYWGQVIKSVPSFINNSLYWSSVMFKNYFKLTIRNLAKNKTFSFINIFGLAVGMACCIVVMLFVQDEFSYDKFHENADNIYQLAHDLTTSTGRISKSYFTRSGWAPMLIEEYPEIIDAVRFLRRMRNVSYEGKRFREIIYYVDPGFLDVFTFPLMRGDKETALNEPHSVLITEKLALKYFGQEDPMGKVLNIDKVQDFIVTGILKEVPNNSHIKFDFIASYISEINLIGEENSERTLLAIYLLLKKDATQELVERKLRDFALKQYGEQRASRYNYYLQPLTSIHLYSDLGVDFGDVSDVKYSYLYSGIALIVLLIACINFMNLSSAHATRRTKEVGIRKVIGANRSQLFRQFIGESIFMSLIGLFFALTLAYFFLPFFNEFTNKQLSLDPAANLLLYGSLLILSLFVGFIAGCYPAVFLSAFHPVAVIKSNQTPSAKGTVVKKSLTIIQFGASVFFIIGTITVTTQTNFIRNKDLGFEDNNVVGMLIPSLDKHFYTLKSELLKNPGITDVTASLFPPGVAAGGNLLFTIEGYPEEEKANLYFNSVGFDFFSFYEIEFAKGRDFSEAISSDENDALIINETAAEIIGWDSPIGKRIYNDKEEIKGRVIGVIKDYHTASLYEEIKPTVFTVDKRFSHYLSVKIRPEKTTESVAFIEAKYKQFFPDGIFRFSFLEDMLLDQYNEEERTGKVFTLSSLLAIILACLGLFGLALFTVERRMKEIGIRKVLGASVLGIITLLSMDFAKLVLAANLIAWPVAYFAMNRWLQNFAYKIELSWWIFVLGGLLTLGIALITVGFQTVKASRANPIDVIRYE